MMHRELCLAFANCILHHLDASLSDVTDKVSAACRQVLTRVRVRVYLVRSEAHNWTSFDP